MSTWFVSRHEGAVAWMKQQPVDIDHWCSHLEISLIKKGDIVIGVLPMNLAAEVCAKGARFYALSFSVNAAMRGKELTKEVLNDLHCTLTRYEVKKA